jgi:hypothetical protein
MRISSAAKRVSTARCAKPFNSPSLRVGDQGNSGEGGKFGWQTLYAVGRALAAAVGGKTYQSNQKYWSEFAKFGFVRHLVSDSFAVYT